MDLVAVEGDRAGVDGVDAADALDQGGLAGAVVADQGGHLAGVDGESDIVQDLDGTEALVDPVEFQKGCRGHGCFSFAG
ncbi:hypothetical protein GCM10020358_02660 [Amorphoplanes nipponensis]